MVYFKIGTTEFTGELNPSNVIPTVQIVKNEERSLNGTMNVDVITRKIRLSVKWKLLGAASMQSLLQLEQASTVLSVGYFDANTGKMREIKAYVDSVEYKPYFDKDTISWQDVTLSLIEI